MKMFLTRDIDPMIQGAKVECALGRLHLFPANRYQSRIDMQLRKLRKDGIGLLCCPGRRISHLSAQN